MCSSKAKVSTGGGGVDIIRNTTPAVPRINGRPVLQPTCNRAPVHHLPTEIRLKGITSQPISPLSPKSPTPIMMGSCDDEKLVIPKASNINRKPQTLKSKSFKETTALPIFNIHTYSSSLIVEAPGSIADGRREQMALQHARRKMKIAHYGRSKSAKFERAATNFLTINQQAVQDHQDHNIKKSCSFITPNSDPIYVAYHDQEWGVPVHDDKMLFELLVLSSAQVGSDWTSILKKRQHYRDAFCGFDAEIVANITEKQIMCINKEYGIDISRVRGVVDNSNRILEIKREFGAFDKYIWRFVNNKAINTQYKFGHKVPVKTSKSESISKDMIRRGFRFVGPTVVLSFMQAAGLTNDHLIACHRHLPCISLATDHH